MSNKTWTSEITDGSAFNYHCALVEMQLATYTAENQMYKVCFCLIHVVYRVYYLCFILIMQEWSFLKNEWMFNNKFILVMQEW